MKKILKKLLALDSTPDEVREKLREAIWEVDRLEDPEKKEAIDEDMSLDDALEKLQELLNPLTENHEKEGEAIRALLDVIAKRSRDSLEKDREELNEDEEDEMLEKKLEIKEEEEKDRAQAQDSALKRRDRYIDSAEIERRIIERIEKEQQLKEMAADDVRSLVGSVMLSKFRTANDVYGFALDELGIDKRTYAPSSYKAVIAGLKHASAQSAPVFMAADEDKDSPLKNIDFTRFHSMGGKY